MLGLEVCERLCLAFRVGSGIYAQVLVLLTFKHLSSPFVIFLVLILENKTQKKNSNNKKPTVPNEIIQKRLSVLSKLVCFLPYAWFWNCHCLQILQGSIFLVSEDVVTVTRQREFKSHLNYKASLGVSVESFKEDLRIVSCTAQLCTGIQTPFQILFFF